MGLKSNKRHQPNPNNTELTPESITCIYCNRPTEFFTTEKIGNLGEVEVRNSSNFLVGKDEKGNKAYCHAACFRGGIS